MINSFTGTSKDRALCCNELKTDPDADHVLNTLFHFQTHKTHRDADSTNVASERADREETLNLWITFLHLILGKPVFLNLLHPHKQVLIHWYITIAIFMATSEHKKLACGLITL